METIALFGAGGKMGLRASDNLRRSRYNVKYVEISRGGIEALKTRGLRVTSEDEAVVETDTVIMAVPDRLIGTALRSVVPKLRSGALVITLDATAAFAGELPSREDISYFVAHPCHPSPFIYRADRDAHRDYFGGIRAKQNIVCALVQGSQSDYLRGEEIVRSVFAPVDRSYQITVEQMAMLEPVLAESLSATCLGIIQQGMEHVISRGVPAEAARDFLLGHIRIALAILFDEVDAEFSEGCKKSMERARKAIIREDWIKIFQKDNIVAETRAIARGSC